MIDQTYLKHPRSRTRKSDSLNSQIRKWLETNAQEFTSGELSALLGKNPDRVSDQLCSLRHEGVLKVTGQSAKYHLYQLRGDNEAPEIKPPPPKLKHICQPGVLGIITHTVDGRIKRVTF